MCLWEDDGTPDGPYGVGGPNGYSLVYRWLSTHPEPLAQYAAILGGIDRITGRKPPVIAVPTTSGTGSEVGRAALITLEDGRKLGFISPHMIPTVAICDPDLTLGLPRAVVGEQPQPLAGARGTRPRAQQGEPRLLRLPQRRGERERQRRTRRGDALVAGHPAQLHPGVVGEAGGGVGQRPAKGHDTKQPTDQIGWSAKKDSRTHRRECEGNDPEGKRFRHARQPSHNPKRRLNWRSLVCT